MNDFELVTIENVVFDGVGKEFVVYVSVSGTLVFLLACGTAWVIIKDFFTSEAWFYIILFIFYKNFVLCHAFELTGKKVRLVFNIN